MRIRTLFIDDDDKDLRKYKQRFETDDRSKNKLKIVPRNTPKSTKDYKEIEKCRPELILVDYDLAKPDADGDVIGISGVTLATELRQKFSEIPIVLFTRKSVFNIQAYSKIKQTLSSIDEIIYKHDLFKSDSELLDILYELSIGFKKLRNCKSRNWGDLLEVLKAPKSDYDKLKLADPPISSGNKSICSVSKVTKWIREVLINYPGILYDVIHSATFLGISKEAFLKSEVQQFFSRAKYTGVFPTPEGRWWKSKLLEIANSKMTKKERSMLIREGFPTAWERINKTSIGRSKCVFSGESPAEWVCYILKKPMMIKYSLTYKPPDSRPSIMDETRVSFEAIRTSNEVNDDLFDSIGKEMLAEIRRMPKKRRR